MKISYHYNNDLKNSMKYITQILETYGSTRRIHNVLDVLTNNNKHNQLCVQFAASFLSILIIEALLLSSEGISKNSLSTH